MLDKHQGKWATLECARKCRSISRCFSFSYPLLFTYEFRMVGAVGLLWLDSCKVRKNSSARSCRFRQSQTERSRQQQSIAGLTRAVKELAGCNYYASTRARPSSSNLWLSRMKYFFVSTFGLDRRRLARLVSIHCGSIDSNESCEAFFAAS